MVNLKSFGSVITGNSSGTNVLIRVTGAAEREIDEGETLQDGSPCLSVWA